MHKTPMFPGLREVIGRQPYPHFFTGYEQLNTQKKIIIIKSTRYIQKQCRRTWGSKREKIITQRAGQHQISHQTSFF